MQPMPQIPEAFFSSIADSEFARLAPAARAHVDAAVADGLDPQSPFVIAVLAGKVRVRNVDEVGVGSTDEINALLAPELPEQYLSDLPGLSDDPHYAAHLADHWGF